MTNPNCLCGCGKPVKLPRHKWLHGHNGIMQRGFKHQGTHKSKHSPSIKDIYWAAGFIEGEAWLGLTGPPSSHAIKVSQVNPEPVYILLSLFGGTIKYTVPNKPNARPYFTWGVYGSRARGVMLTIYTLLSGKRKKQVKDALLAWIDYPVSKPKSYETLIHIDVEALENET